ncbi:glycosyl transferase [Cylindrospermum stagnale PCC 7417]|uniref:Glycosyl transferase n=1 Tax=Cylindrospermum stagnale PCC 7417 TaxID=56107 RepID=K9WSC6_9NOST|nr:glycosyltransferase family 2 protein [Cylindrospermum stagnale]AFZ22699.1 glycosyl transferase [Cylindrospermum stagnale PCC 7417]
MKKVSVIIPVYNAEKYVAATVQSVLSQTYQNLEILIIDDGSDDYSIKICQQFADPRIQIIHQANRGVPGARNTGIRYAQGDYLAFLDADDIWLPTKLAQHVNHLNNSPTVGISFSYSAFIDEGSKFTGFYQKPRKLYDITPSYILCRNPVGNGSAAVIRREVFEEIKFQDKLHGNVEDYYFDERLRQSKADATDIECWLRISIQTHWRHEGLPEALTLYRVNSGGLSANALKQLEALEKVIEKTRSYAPDIIAHCEKPAKAYHLRYTVRRLVSLGEGITAVKLFNQVLANHWRILLEEPGRTLLTGVAAYLLWFLYPLKLFILKSKVSA